jgi:hypothetical protein
MTQAGKGGSSRRTASARASGRAVRKTASAKTRRASSEASSKRGRKTSRAAAKRSTAASARAHKSQRRRSRRGHLRLVAENERLERLIGELGNNRVAELLSVSRSQPSRWRTGKEGIGPENQRKLIDLDYVFGRLEQLYPSRQAQIWLTSHNAYLGGRPIDVLKLKGALPVIDAIDAEAEGAFV